MLQTTPGSWQLAARTYHPEVRPTPRVVRRALLVVGVLGLLLLALVAWIGVRAVQVKGDLESARGALTGLDADPAELAASVDLVRLAAEETSSAVRRTGDPVWRLAEHGRWLGDGLCAVRVVAVAADGVQVVTEPRDVLSEPPDGVARA